MVRGGKYAQHCACFLPQGIQASAEASPPAPAEGIRASARDPRCAPIIPYRVKYRNPGCLVKSSRVAAVRRAARTVMNHSSAPQAAQYRPAGAGCLVSAHRSLRLLAATCTAIGEQFLIANLSSPGCRRECNCLFPESVRAPTCVLQPNYRRKDGLGAQIYMRQCATFSRTASSARCAS